MRIILFLMSCKWLITWTVKSLIIKPSGSFFIFIRRWVRTRFYSQYCSLTEAGHKNKTFFVLFIWNFKIILVNLLLNFLWNFIFNFITLLVFWFFFFEFVWFLGFFDLANSSLRTLHNTSYMHTCIHKCFFK